MTDYDAPIRKRRVHIYKQYCDRGVRMTFPIGEDWYLIEHDELVRIIGETTPFLDSPSWQEHGAYSTPHPSKRLRAALEAYRIGGAGSVDAPTFHR